MTDEAGFRSLLNEHAISKVVSDWGYARDGEDWDALKACFHSDATVEIMWISGSARAFIESFRNRPPQKPGEHTRHQVGTPRIRMRGDRAVSECPLTLFSRVLVDDLPFDFTAWARFFDLFEKRGGAWRIFRRTAIYEKDRMDPVQPEKVPSSFYESMRLENYPPECRFMCFRHMKQGRGAAPRIITAGSPEERARREAGERWLAGEAAGNGE